MNDFDRLVEEAIKQDTVKEEQPVVEKQAAGQPKQGLMSAYELMNLDLPELKVIVGVGEQIPFLVEGLCIIASPPKTGKSFLSLGMCNAVALGSDFLGYKTCGCDTLYYDLESSQNLEKKRLEKIAESMGSIAPNFYIKDQAPTMIDGQFEKELIKHLKDNPNIGLVIVDVFQKIRRPKGKNEDDYTALYRDMDSLLKIAHEYHIALILIHHTTKGATKENGFDAILGSVAFQGKTDQMIVLIKEKFTDDITKIYGKGRTIDGMIELDATINNGVWQKCDKASIRESAQEQLKQEYMDSDIRQGVLAILEHTKKSWKGRCSRFIDDCLEIGLPITIPVKEVGKFFNQYRAFFLKYDGIDLKVVKNGTGPNIYEFAIHDNSPLITIDGWETTIDEIPFK